MHSKHWLTSCIVSIMVAYSVALSAETLRPPPPPDQGPTGMSLPLPPPDKALASDGAPPPVPFGRAREVLAPNEPSAPSFGYADPYASMGMQYGGGYGGYGDYDDYMDEYGMEPDDSYMYWSPPIPAARPSQPGTMPIAPSAPTVAQPAPILGEPMLLDQFPRTLAEMNPADYQALSAYPDYDSWPMHDRVDVYTRLFEQTRGRKPHFDRSVTSEARASAPRPQTIREANQDLYRPSAGGANPADHGKMDSLRGSLRRDLFGGGR